MAVGPDRPAGRPVPRPFRRAVIRGLGVLLPPLLTIVILLWIYNTVRLYALEPVESGVRWSMAWSIMDVRTELPNGRPRRPHPRVRPLRA